MDGTRGEAPGVRAPDGGPHSNVNRVRVWIVVGSLVLVCLGLAGLFILILMGIDGEPLLVWQAALGSVMPMTAAATAYYFSRPGDKNPSAPE